MLQWSRYNWVFFKPEKIPPAVVKRGGTAAEGTKERKMALMLVGLPKPCLFLSKVLWLVSFQNDCTIPGFRKMTAIQGKTQKQNEYKVTSYGCFLKPRRTRSPNTHVESTSNYIQMHSKHWTHFINWAQKLPFSGCFGWSFSQKTIFGLNWTAYSSSSCWTRNDWRPLKLSNTLCC